MKQLLTFLCALLFALAGKAAPAGDELKQLLAEARAIVNTAGNAADREVSRALSEARRAVNATDRQIDRAMAEARRGGGGGAGPVAHARVNKDNPPTPQSTAPLPKRAPPSTPPKRPPSPTSRSKS